VTSARLSSTRRPRSNDHRATGFLLRAGSYTLVMTPIERRLILRPIRIGNVPAGTHSSRGAGRTRHRSTSNPARSLICSSRELSVLTYTFFLI
jgi:hypothetical protein